MRRKIVAGLLLGLLAATIVIALDGFFNLVARIGGIHQLRAIEARSYDWRLSHMARPETARTDIALIEIDEYSLRNLEPYAGRWPWPRVVHSMLIDYLAKAGAKVVGYDVNFAGADTRKGFAFGDTQWSGTESDAALVDSVKQAGNLVMLADATYEATEGVTPPTLKAPFRLTDPAVIERKLIFPPFDTLAKASAAAGHNLFIYDAEDGVLRHTVPFVRTEGGRAIPSLGLAAALRVAGVLPGEVSIDGHALHIRDRVIPLEPRHVRTASGVSTYAWALIDFRGPPFLADLKTRPYPHYSFWDVYYSQEQLDNHVKPNIDPAVFRDKIVFVGVTAAGLYDVFETPFGGGKMPGIQVHAAVADDFLSGRFLRQSSNGVRLTTVIVGALALGVVATLLPAWWATAVMIGVAAVYGWLATRLFATGYWLNITQPGLANALALFGGVGYQYFVEGREKRKMKKLFGQYVSKDVYEQLVADPARARLGGTRREMTVLFSDIRGFTTVSERGQPEEIVHLLNEYFTRMVELVFQHKGTVDKFVGDMVMALFGAPLDDPQHPDHAVQCALAMITELHKLNEKWKDEGRPTIDIGIGINTGPMIAGNIGSEQIMSYTVIGDSVNLGSRLESLNKQYGTRIIISDATRERLSGAYQFKALGDVVVKGKTKPVAIFEVIGADIKDEARV